VGSKLPGKIIKFFRRFEIAAYTLRGDTIDLPPHELKA
jgi:hypothetical protein